MRAGITTHPFWCSSVRAIVADIFSVGMCSASKFRGNRDVSLSRRENSIEER